MKLFLLVEGGVEDCPLVLNRINGWMVPNADRTSILVQTPINNPVVEDDDECDDGEEPEHDEDYDEDYDEGESAF